MRAELMEHLLTIDEAVERSGYTAQYLRRLARRGKLQAFKVGHVWVVDAGSLNHYRAQADTTEDQRFGPREERGEAGDR